MKTGFLLASMVVLGAAPASAEVVQATPGGFEVKQVVTVDAPIAQAWAALMLPQKWWDHEHTYSDDSANLSLDSHATGCFCERIPKTEGSVEHAHIVYIQPPRMIRMVGALGPLQAEAVTGTLTFRLDPETEKTTRITLDYVVGGYVRAGADTLAPKVDEVLATQMVGLKAAAEAGVSGTPAAKPEPESR
jgi:uncharacterized protein YndB with AHSA1/START domain